MTREEHLLVILSEECCEVAHRASKALRFGLDEVQAGQDLTNAQRLTAEMADLLAVWSELRDESGEDLPSAAAMLTDEFLQLKRVRLDKYFELSRKLGKLDKETKE